MSSNPTTLVLGGTGKTGRRIVDRLTARRVPVRIGSRSGTVRFDWSDRATWSAVLADVDAVYLSYAPDLAVPSAIDDIRAFTDLAVSAGVQRLVLLSGRGEDEAQSCEKVVQESGVDWTIIRASWFNQNFSENYLLEPVLAGEVILPAAEVAEPFVDADDIADVAVAALTEAGHTGQVYEVTGPRLLTFADAVAEIAAATGRPIRFTPTSAADYATALTDHGVPSDAVTLLTYLFTTVLDGRNAHLADGVQRALGRPPRDFTDYCRDVAATGGWTA
ncbi:NAD(P)H-binding protein [Micromonospora sp. NPDC047620]|uniref:NAD(P)H-binding protein n=1 Tax=Micromonospora sp. NPDC047620 TaxID=3364251 RepID=UPI003710812D